MSPESPHERLDRLMEERRLDLGLRWEEIADRAKLKYETIRGVRKGESGGRPMTRRAISVALAWTPDSVDRILAGKDPEEAAGAYAEIGDLKPGAKAPQAPASEEEEDRAATIAAVQQLYGGTIAMNAAMLIMTQWHKPLAMRRAELAGIARAVRDDAAEARQ